MISSAQDLSRHLEMVMTRLLQIPEIIARCFTFAPLDEVSDMIAEMCFFWNEADMKHAKELLPRLAWQKLSDPKYMSIGTGRTLLHHAAEKNKLELCKALVEHAGVSVRPRDMEGREPYQLTTCRAVHAYLHSQIRFEETRFGSGDAMDAAEKDASKVMKLTWYTIPLPGIAGSVGGKHSFVHVTTHGLTSYILEKAQPRCSEHDGTFVSFWQGNDLVSEATVLQDVCQIKEGVTMKDLIKVSVQAGDYRLSTCNCHHIARNVFNHCCADMSEKFPIELLPNGVVALLFGDAISAGSMSTSSGSVRSESKSDGSLNAPAGADVPIGFSNELDLSNSSYTHEAAFLSALVYSNPQMPEPGPRSIRVRNRLTETLRLQRRDRSGMVREMLLRLWTSLLQKMATHLSLTPNSSLLMTS